LLEAVKRYFALERPVLGATGIEMQLVLYTGVLAGSIGRWAFKFVENDATYSSLAMGAIASVVIFPTIYYSAGLDKLEANFVKWCVAFQNGFFWPTLLEQVGKAIGK
jgi:hypothetical protein